MCACSWAGGAGCQEPHPLFCLMHLVGGGDFFPKSGETGSQELEARWSRLYTLKVPVETPQGRCLISPWTMFGSQKGSPVPGLSLRIVSIYVVIEAKV